MVLAEQRQSCQAGSGAVACVGKKRSGPPFVLCPLQSLPTAEFADYAQTQLMEGGLCLSPADQRPACRGAPVHPCTRAQRPRAFCRQANEFCTVFVAMQNVPKPSFGDVHYRRPHAQSVTCPAA